MMEKNILQCDQLVFDSDFFVSCMYVEQIFLAANFIKSLRPKTQFLFSYLSEKLCKFYRFFIGRNFTLKNSI